MCEKKLTSLSLLRFLLGDSLIGVFMLEGGFMGSYILCSGDPGSWLQ